MKENPLIPMMAITGKPSKEILTEKLEIYRKQGISQLMIYPRTGLELDYLGTKWFAVCKHIIEEAERFGFTSIWIYDEFNWPSGTCNKLVFQKNPDYAMKQLCVSQVNGKYEFAVRHSSRMSDLMNTEAVDCFIEMTHEQYAKHLGKYFGKLIKGFFSDEPDIAFFSYENEEDILRLPYYPGLEDDYKELTGSDLFNDISSGLKNNSEFYQHACNKLCAKKFRTNFAERLSLWCQQHNVALTGHLMNEYSSSKALRCNGHPLHVLGAFSMPGMDEIFTHRDINCIEWLTFGTVMHALEAKGNHGGMAELFAVGPCDLTPAQIRRQLWLVAMFGINKYAMAVSPLDHRGNAEKKFYFNPCSPTQPWFQAYDILGEEAIKAAEFATQERLYTIEVRYPYSPEPLTDLLKHLTEKQYAWKLLAPEEEATSNVVIVPKDGGIYEERSNIPFFDFQRMENDLLKYMELRPAYVTDRNDELARDLFVRCFKDGGCVVIDLSGKSRELRLKRKSVYSDFTLPAEGVITFPGWQVELNRPNTLRLNFTDGKCVLKLSEGCSNLRFAVRNYAEQPELLFDKKPVEAKISCSDLLPGFNEIYLTSTKFDLVAGEHTVELKNDAEDYAFLPNVWLIGEFAVSLEGVVSPYQHDGVGLSGYAGTISQRAKVTIQSDIRKLSVSTQGLASELVINGKSMGKRLWEPFCWIIPEEYLGSEVDIEIKRYTSCGRVFGKEAFEVKDPWLKKYKPDNHTEIKPFCELIWG